MLFRSNDTATTEIYTSLHTLSLHDALPITSVEELDADTRQEEIARMLSGSTITAEARAAAASLIAGARP